MSNLLFGPNGKAVGTQVTKQYDPRLVAALAILQPLLDEQGLSLFCLKCQALGMKDGVRGFSSPGEYVLDCGCSHRVLSANGKATIQ